MSVPDMSLSIDPTKPTKRRNGCKAAISAVTSPDSTSFATTSAHSSRNKFAAVRLAPTPLRTELVAPRGAKHRATAVQDPPDVRGRHAPDCLAPVDQTLIPVVDHIGVNSAEQRRPNHCPDRGVHPTGVPAAGEYRDT